MKKGDKVRYYAHENAMPEKGIVKTVIDGTRYVFVVYSCGGDWENYENYTGCNTDSGDLKMGWDADKPDLYDANGRPYDPNQDEAAAWKAYYEEQAYLDKLI